MNFFKLTKRILLSDKILLNVFVFSSLLLIAIRIIFGGSLEQIIILSYVVYGLAFATTFVISRKFSKKLLAITLSVEEMAAGNLSKRLPSAGKDEIGQLAVALNELLSRLETGVAIDVSKHREIDQAKTDFVSLASHQLRTPLSIIKWYIDYLVSGDAGGLNDEQTRYLKEVYKSNERLIELVNALLDVSRIDLGTFSIEPEPTDIVERAESALARFAREITAKKIVLEKNYDVFPSVNLDPRLTKIVFENIISNAVKYTPEKGKIRIDIKRTDDNIFIKVADTGCGIPREQQPKVFSKFFRADNVKKIEAAGTGLGLYIVRAIVRKSGGKIWFESPGMDLFLEGEKTAAGAGKAGGSGGGAAFFITIPLKGMKKRAGTKKLSSSV